MIDMVCTCISEYLVPDDDYLSDDVLDTAAITHGKLHKTLRDALKHIKDDLCRKGEEVEEDTKTVTEAAEAMKTAKAEKSDKDSTDIHISILEREMQNMQKSLEMLTEKIQEFCSSTKKEATNTESISTPCGVNRRYSKQDLTALRVIEIQELQIEGVLCKKSKYKHGRTNWVRRWEKDNSNCWNVFQRKPLKDGLRVQLLIPNTFHKATHSQTLDKTLVCEKMHQSLFMVLIDTLDLTDQCSWTLLCNVHCFQCKQFELFYY